MSPLAVWSRSAAVTLAALASMLLLAPDHPSERLPLLLQPVAGVVAGSVLFLVVTRRRACPPVRAVSLPLLLARCGLLGLLATNEEIVWRRVALGELLFGGATAALAASTLAFALAHRARPALHLLTGATFGGLYLATGALASSIVAHWAYNVLVVARSRRPRLRGARP